MYITDLADVLKRADLVVHEELGLDKVTGQMISWKGFGRSSNSQYYFNRPTVLMLHHTVSNTTPANDVNYCNVGSSIRPLTNIVAPRNGDMHVLAGGPTNTNGSGLDTWGGGTPANLMNIYAIGMEISSLGASDSLYPVEQQDAVMKAAIAICKAYDISPGNVRAHFEWAPTRKVDPKGISRWSPYGGKWDMDSFRREVFMSLTNPQPPQPPIIKPGVEVDMKVTDPFRMFDSRDWGMKVDAGEHEFEVPAHLQPADALMLTVTVTESEGTGYLSTYSEDRPVGSNLNFQGQSIANTTITLTKNNKFHVFVNKKTHLILDINASG